ncbi:hypothetical protein EJ08DRAFT_314828 [Tothia fuscella]|uniref:Uncharacterized protein n=1 Tax=Tothia fuscella TaxID=1048955 RepID=A0A9P4NPD0_9PEZI|nr:hypothetical protein EJ08DRAFT_314828 [Tothia fuscella]
MEATNDQPSGHLLQPQAPTLDITYSDLAADDDLIIFSKYGDIASESRIKSLDKFGFEQIVRTTQEIEHIKQRLASHSKTSRHKKLRAHCRLEELETHLTKLQNGHEEVAEKIRLQARALTVMPRELRDAIFEQLYTYEKPIEFSWSRVGETTVFPMPKDEALYLSELHVGPQIALEAAKIFYKSNVFAFRSDNDLMCTEWLNPRIAKAPWTQEKFNQWTQTDHYGSGIVPSDIVRKLSIHMCSSTEYGLCAFQHTTDGAFETAAHLHYEKILNKHIADNAGWGYVYNAWNHREQLQYMLTLDSLREVYIDTPTQKSNADQFFRLISPYVFQLREKGVKVFVKCKRESDAPKDVSHFFDTPTPEDHIQFECIAGRPRINIPEMDTDPTVLWWALSKEQFRSSYDWETVEAGFVRVWLQEHYDVFKFYQRHQSLLEELGRIRDAVAAQNNDVRAVWRDNYARVVGMMPPFVG